MIGAGCSVGTGVKLINSIVMAHATLEDGQGLTLVPVSAQLELFCPLYNTTELMNVSRSCLS